MRLRIRLLSSTIQLSPPSEWLVEAQTKQVDPVPHAQRLTSHQGWALTRDLLRATAHPRVLELRVPTGDFPAKYCNASFAS